jgi:putative Mg2+ transporter-C (MgtC) family protein
VTRFFIGRSSEKKGWRGFEFAIEHAASSVGGKEWFLHLTLTWHEVVIRILCALAAGALLGLNRSEHGRPAGLRTSMLVSLAACLAMLQVNSLLPLAGRASNSFVMNDLMRLPLGILSGMGFIGAGAIVSKDSLVVGVTTAATLWFLTVIGLCFGGGEVALGLAGTAVGLGILAGAKWFEDRLEQDHQGNVLVVTDNSGPGEEQIRHILLQSGLLISGCELEVTPAEELREWNCQVHWRSKPEESKVPDAVKVLGAMPGVVRIAWRPQFH